MSRLGALGGKLYSGEVSYDFIARRKVWYAFSAILLLVSIGSLAINNLKLGIEFRGGAEFRITSPEATPDKVTDVINDIHKGQITTQSVGKNEVRAQTERLSTEEQQRIQERLAKRFGVSEQSISTQFIGASWGSDISAKALRALLFFLLFVMLFLSLYFEWKMALAAMVALVHDLVITVGVYSLVGFEVTPATVIGFLTILGYSLYDTVVVFDKVRENTRGLAGGSRMTYSGAANLAVNQTLVRSINTSVVALLPIAAILTVGITLLGSGPLKDLALVLFVGVAAGAYSSIFIATPVLAALKEREPGMQALARRVAARKTGSAGASVAPARKSGAMASSSSGRGGRPVEPAPGPGEGEMELNGEIVPAPSGAPLPGAARTTPKPRPAGGTRAQPKRSGKGKAKGKRR